ncbi:adenine phosphoribosyltransferase [Corynebacterium kefirresidentii]|uniref:Adenine phosphoribosyltransferase n=1 Tax=Corynebacterium kefirresidentii TaxID=1979527 RepID=A0ABT8Q371_9CORY|nr:adenine phosphoribosyltransferase [Corynebacterium kefirresidentii]MDN8619257.1 adenine phosphoribosyltransferase [Corynebacterium kefirresidentii]MDN8641095.1 adenine phosphoribosyltransferase [Corynebacterium kefirresidentii]
MSSHYESAAQALQDKVRLVQDFPEEGILFEDLTPVLADPEAFRTVVDGLAAACEELGAEMIGGLDARGFLLGSAVAYKMGLGILAIRKKGKLPPPVYTEEYELEYGSAALEIPASGVDIKGKRVVLVDDVLATGGTLHGAKLLLESAGAEVAGNVVVLEVKGLNGRERLSGPPLIVLNATD